MSDIWARMSLVAGALLVVGLSVMWGRIKTRPPTREIVASDLKPGIYLFTSGGCSTCEEMKDRLERVVGDHGYTELSWEHEADTFSRLSVDIVPSVMTVRDGGDGRLHPGRLPRSIRRL